MARALYFWTGDCQSSKQSLGFLHPLHPCLQESAPENISKSLCTLILWLLVWSVDGKKLTSVIQISTFDPFYSKAWPVPYIILRIIIIPRHWCDLLCLQNIVCISAAAGKGGHLLLSGDHWVWSTIGHLVSETKKKNEYKDKGKGNYKVNIWQRPALRSHHLITNLSPTIKQTKQNKSVASWSRDPMIQII